MGPKSYIFWCFCRAETKGQVLLGVVFGKAFKFPVMFLEEGFGVALRWEVRGGLLVGMREKRKGAGGRGGWEQGRELASQCARVCQNHPLPTFSFCLILKGGCTSLMLLCEPLCTSMSLYMFIAFDMAQAEHSTLLGLSREKENSLKECPKMLHKNPWQHRGKPFLLKMGLLCLQTKLFCLQSVHVYSIVSKRARIGSKKAQTVS